MADADPGKTTGEAGIAEVDVVIVGASFTGIEVLHQLRRRAEGRGLRVALVDRFARHGYLPLVHERLCRRLAIAASDLETGACVDVDADAKLWVGEVVAIDPGAKEVTLADGRRLRGRFLVIAVGSILAPPPAIVGREHLRVYKLQGEQAAAGEALAGLLAGAGAGVGAGAGGGAGGGGGGGGGGGEAPRITVIGGGISGVELAGELAHLARARPEGWRAPRITLVQGGPRILPGFAARVARRVHRHLVAQGVEVILGARVVEAEAGRIRLAEAAGERWVASDMSFWSGGIRPAPLVAALALPRTEAGWLAVGPTLQCFPTAIPSDPEVFAGGDAVRVIGGEGEWPTMQRAIECLWQAKVIARNILTLAAEPAGYPSGVPPLDPHRLRRDFFHGISLGARSLVVYGPLMLDVAAFGVWFRRFLMRQYFARYRPG